MITLTRTGLLLTLSADTIPAQGSSGVPISFVNDPETYSGYTIQPLAGWYKNGCKQSAVCGYSDGTITVPAAAFQHGGEIMLAIALIDTSDPNHIEVTQPASAYVIPAPNDPTELPDEDTWQQAVQAFTQTIFDNYTSDTVQPILNDAQQALTNANQAISTANQQQQQIDSAISQMGEYQIVSEDPVQIQFKQGDGTYGQTVDLGDGLASKSMVNAGYYQSISTQYSGSASDYGIEVAQIQGAYVQDGTPTPTAPIEPQFVKINNFNTNGSNLFDASKLPTTSAGGATVTNNGDGSFTISGSGSSTSVFAISYLNENIINQLKVGNIYLNCESSYPYFYVELLNSAKGTIAAMASNGSKTIDITSQMLSQVYFVRYGFYGASETLIQANTIKPMLYQDGDGTWYPFGVSNQSFTTPINLCALPNGVSDTLDAVNVGEIMFDGSSDENWQASSNNVFFTAANNGTTNFNVNAINLLCDKLEIINTNIVTSAILDNQIKYGNTSGGLNNIYLKISNINSISDLQTWLQSNPITVWYQLNTPTTQDITIPTLQSFYPFTNAWCDSLVQPQITWNVLTGRSSVLDGNGNLLSQVYITAPPNGLINGDFMINQRGQSSYVGSASEYVLSVDCWCLDENTGLTVTPNSGGSITLENTSSQALGIYQQLPNLTFPCAAGMKLDGADAQYFLFEEANTFNVGANAQIAIIQIGSSYWLKLIVNASQTITIDYADYWPGEVAYKHVFEPYAIAFERCRSQIINDDISLNTVFVYSSTDILCRGYFKKLQSYPNISVGTIGGYGSDGSILTAQSFTTPTKANGVVAVRSEFASAIASGCNLWCNLIASCELVPQS